MDSAREFSSQWQNPGDILSLLLLIGGDIVQKAIAQLFGVYVQPVRGSPRIYLTPVAFSFGWVGYAFNSLTSVIGDKQLMPSLGSSHSIVINCDTGYVRINRSWLLERVLRDHEIAVEAHPGPQAARLTDGRMKREAGLDEDKPLRMSLRIDIFDLSAGLKSPRIDRIWILGWITIAAQLAISVAPWKLYNDWTIFLVTACGTLFALLTGSLRQWNLEKWPGRRLNEQKGVAARGGKGDSASDVEKAQSGRQSCTGREHPDSSQSTAVPRNSKDANKSKSKVVCLTRGNGHRHVMVLTGTGTAWDLESMATATSDSLPETRWCLIVLAVAWVCLLISVAGLKEHTWFLLLIGGLGMLQNLYASAAPRNAASLGLTMAPKGTGLHHTIIGASIPEWPKDDDSPPDVIADQEFGKLLNHALDPLETIGVRGALRELEKRFPGAGFALMPEFFPAQIQVEPKRYRHQREHKFWEWMFENRKLEQRPELVFKTA